MSASDDPSVTAPDPGVRDPSFVPDENLRYGRYTVLRRDDGSPWELGRGGMGVTYRAEDPELRRAVVLKVILPTLFGNDPQARARFRREARSAAGVHHPHIATVFDIGEARGEDYYVMEYIAGEDLLTRLKRDGPLDVPTVLRIGQQVAEALDAAWEPARIVHRDLKPANLMLARRPSASATREARGGTLVKIVDFGLAKALKAAGEIADSAGATEVSGASRPVFSAAYASPEQIDGDRELDIRSDLYSLGVTLWHCLVGHPTFGNTSYQRALVGHLTQEPPFGELDVVGVPGPVIALLRHLLMKSPDDRPQTPEAALDEINLLVGGLSGSASQTFAPGAAGPAEPGVEPLDELSSAETMFGPRSRPPEAGHTLDGRYRLDAMIGDGVTGRVFRAADLQAEGATVALKMIPARSFAAEPTDFLTHLNEEITRIQSAPHPQLRAVFGLGAGNAGQHPFLVSEWIEGFTLLTLLRRRGGLTPPEALLLGRQIAAGVDHANRHGLGAVDLALHQIFLQFPGGLNAETGTTLPEAPLAKWPEFVVKLDPLAVLPDFQGANGGDHTMINARPLLPSGSPVRALALLFYELLHGAPLAPSGTYTPLPKLNEQANEALRGGLAPVPPFASAGEFCEALGAAQTPLAAEPAPSRPHVPALEQTPPPRTNALVVRPELSPRTRPDVPVPVAPLPLVAANPPRKSRRGGGRVAAILLLSLGLPGAGGGIWFWQRKVTEEREEKERADAEKIRLEQVERDRQARAVQVELEAVRRRADDAANQLEEQKRLETLRTIQEQERQRKEEADRQAKANEEDRRKQKEEADRVAKAKAVPEVLKVNPDDEVLVVREEPFYLQGQPQTRKAQVGEKLRVLEYRPDLARVFVPALDASGREIANIRLSIAATAVRAVPVNVGSLLGQAIQNMESGNGTEVEKLLARAGRSAPQEAAVAKVRAGIEQLKSAQDALRQAQLATQTAQTEAKRLRQNAHVEDSRLNLIGPHQNTAKPLREEADRLEKVAAGSVSAAEKQLEAAKRAVHQIPLPPPPATP